MDTILQLDQNILLFIQENSAKSSFNWFPGHMAKTNYDKLTKAQKNEVKSIATEAAKIVDLKLVFNKKSVAIYNNDGKLVETVSNTNGKLAYTGNVVNVVVLATTVVALVAVSAVVARKRIVNA